MGQLQREGIRTVISDPVPNRNFAKLAPPEAKAARNARRSSSSKSGKQLLRRRGMHLERSFAHLLDAGGARRTTLRGLENLNKRLKVSAAIYNLSQLMRKIWAVGTPKQWAAGANPLGWIFLHLFAVRWLGFPMSILRWSGSDKWSGEKSGTILPGWIGNIGAAFFPRSVSRS